MIVCLDGPYGVGKTAVADELKPKLEKMDYIIIDSDSVYIEWVKDNPLHAAFGGTMPQFNRHFVAYYLQLLTERMRVTGKNIISVMALTDDICRNGILQELRNADVNVKHIVLMATEGTIMSRIKADKKRKDNSSEEWVNSQLAYLYDKSPEEYRIYTDDRSIKDVASEVFSIISHI